MGVERRMTFWSCAKAPFEAEFKRNLKKLAKLCGIKRDKIVENLINYDKEAWCKTYFRFAPGLSSPRCEGAKTTSAVRVTQFLFRMAISFMFTISVAFCSLQEGSATHSQVSTSRAISSSKGRERGMGKASSSSREGVQILKSVVQLFKAVLVQLLKEWEQVLKVLKWYRCKFSSGARSEGTSTSSQGSGACTQSTQVSGAGASSQVSGASTQGSSAAVRGRGRKMQHTQVSSDSGRGAFKKPRIVGHGVFVGKSGYMC